MTKEHNNSQTPSLESQFTATMKEADALLKEIRAKSSKAISEHQSNSPNLESRYLDLVRDYPEIKNSPTKKIIQAIQKIINDNPFLLTKFSFACPSEGYDEFIFYFSSKLGFSPCLISILEEIDQIFLSLNIDVEIDNFPEEGKYIFRFNTNLITPSPIEEKKRLLSIRDHIRTFIPKLVVSDFTVSTFSSGNDLFIQLFPKQEDLASENWESARKKISAQLQEKFPYLNISLGEQTLSNEKIKIFFSLSKEFVSI